MKFHSVFVLLFLFVECVFAQTIHRVNNNLGVTGLNVYTTAQAAHDAANANDIIYIEPSAGNYGTLTITKPLKIYGNGYFLDTNTELKADTRGSYLDALILSSGSNGSEVYGLTIGGTVVIGSSTIKLERNYLMSGLNLNNTASISDITIRNNWINNFIQQQNSQSISNVLISNNLFAGVSMSGNWSSIIIRHNTYHTTISQSLFNCVFENNLLLGTSTLVLNNVSYNNNVSAGNTFSGGTSNINNFNITAALKPTGAGVSADEQYQIISGSALKTAGSGSTEVGAFGGATPYIISGIAAIPGITTFTGTSTGSNTTPLQVTISVKSNN